MIIPYIILVDNIFFPNEKQNCKYSPFEGGQGGCWNIYNTQMYIVNCITPIK